MSDRIADRNPSYHSASLKTYMLTDRERSVLLSLNGLLFRQPILKVDVKLITYATWQRMDQEICSQCYSMIASHVTAEKEGKLNLTQNMEFVHICHLYHNCVGLL